jgi:hypothetical protein
MSDFSIKTKLEGRGVNTDALEAGVIESFNKAIAGIATATQGEWVRMAQARLGSSRDTYIQGLRQAESFKAFGTSDRPTFEIQLVGRMPNNFEFGMESFDMKGVRPGWLGGGKAKTAADGSTYVTIPFRHSKSNSPRMGYTGKAAGADPNLKTQLRQATKKYGLDRMIRTATGQVVQGNVARIPNKAPVHPYLQGLTRIQKAASGSIGGKQRGSGQLMTFRRMSSKSDPSSWIHPGIDGANIMPDVERWVDGQLDKIMDQILGAA